MLDKKELKLEGLDLKIYNYLKKNGAIDRESLRHALNIPRTTCFDHLDKKLLKEFNLVVKFTNPTFTRGKPPTLWCLKKDKRKYFVEHPYIKPILNLLEEHEILSTLEIYDKLSHLKEASILCTLKKLKYKDLLDSIWHHRRIYWYSKANNYYPKEYFADLLRSL